MFAKTSIAPVLCQGNTPASPTGDVWYNINTISNPSSTNATITVNNSGGTFDPVIAVYSGNPGAGCGGLTLMACANATGAGGSEVLALSNLTAGTRYYVRVYGTNAADANTFTITATGAALPVTLASISGVKQGLNNKLSWTTETELNNKGFELQRSADGVNFTTISFINSQAISGNSNSILNYNYLDKGITDAINYYRLKQIDKDGSFNYSSIVLLKSAKPATVNIVALYPNPASATLTIDIESPTSNYMNVEITDAAGKVILKKSSELIAGANRLSVDVKKLAPGNYFLKGYFGKNGVTPVLKFLKQ